eukprot:5859681-Prymnesium_polylepis.1
MASEMAAAGGETNIHDKKGQPLPSLPHTAGREPRLNICAMWMTHDCDPQVLSFNAAIFRPPGTHTTLTGPNADLQAQHTRTEIQLKSCTKRGPAPPLENEINNTGQQLRCAETRSAHSLWPHHTGRRCAACMPGKGRDGGEVTARAAQRSG